MLRPDIKRLEQCHHEASSSDDSDDDDNDDNDTPSHKKSRVIFQSCAQSSTAPAQRDDNKVSIPDEEEMKRDLEDLQGESDENNSNKDNGIDDGR